LAIAYADEWASEGELKEIMMTETISKLNRYTTLPILLDYLERKKLVLLDPSLTWDDKNDTLIIEEYKKAAKIEKLFALCFSHKSETIHHWKTFANGSSGCCIEFDGKKLIEIFDVTKNLKHGIVNYKKINDTRPSTFALKDIPFIKRVPYTTENEYRVIWEGTTGNTFEIDVPLENVRRITFSQQMPESVFETLKAMMVRNYPILSKKIFRSTVYENKTWIKNFKKK
jgi:hypothetical protein